jgi:hypothetical protein
LRDGALTSLALLLSFAAFDDITTGNETDFTVEYGALVVSAGWLLFVVLSLVRSSRSVLGSISLVAALAAGDSLRAKADGGEGGIRNYMTFEIPNNLRRSGQ